MQHPAIGHDDAKSAVTFREMRTTPFPTEHGELDERFKDYEILTARMATRTIHKLESCGNTLTESHRDVVGEVSALLSFHHHCRFPIRKAIGLPTGTGKTTQIQSYVICAPNHPFLVLVPTLDELESYRACLEAEGLGSDVVGVVFNEASADDPDCKCWGRKPTPTSHLPECRIVLACHARGDTRRDDLNAMRYYKGEERTLIMDEAIRVGDTTVYDVKDLSDEIDTLRLSESAAMYFREVLRRISFTKDGVISLPRQPPDLSPEVIRAIASEKLRYSKKRPTFPVVEAFLTVPNEIRVRGKGFFWYIETFPRFESMFIFDANHVLSKLAKKDKSIDVEKLDVAKQWDRVTIHLRWDWKRGIEHITKLRTEVIFEVKRLVAEALTLHRKPYVVCKTDMYDEIRRKLPAYVPVITYGKHRGSNDLAECDVSIHVGQLRMRNDDVEAQICMNERNLAADVSDAHLLADREAGLNDWQALSRGASRVVENIGDVSQAKPMDIYLLGMPPDEHLAVLKEAMPGVNLDIETEDSLFEAIYDHLKGKEECSLNALSRNVPQYRKLSRSMKERVISCLSGWTEADDRKANRKIVRVSL
jgi:hypothetical protein